MFAASKTASVSGGYQIQRSLRFNSADSAYLNRTPASAGNQQKWTWSCWVKRNTIANIESLFFANTGANRLGIFWYYGNFIVFGADGSGNSTNLTTTSVYRDFSAWYHVVVAFDTTQATASNRVKIYFNAVEVTSFSTANYPVQNSSLAINGVYAHNIGRQTYLANDSYCDDYITEVNFIDGQQLTPSSFGETNAQTGVWQPKAYSGSYGTNGFYLNFSDNSNTTAATLGKDYSGNGNNWTPNNFSVTAGAGNDSLVDSPTSYGTDTGVGGTVRGNYATFNPLDRDTVIVVSNGNLTAATSANWERSIRGTMAFPSTGKWYFEVVGSGNSNYAIGIADSTTPLGSPSSGYNVLYSDNAYKYVNGSLSPYGATFTSGDVIGIAYDADSNSINFYKNNTAQGAISVTSGKEYFPYLKFYNATVDINLGQRPFAYTAPSGYKALCTQNLPTPTIGATTATNANKYFTPVLYTGNGSSQSITVGFQPDWVWTKGRNVLSSNWVIDAVRGAGNYLNTNGTGAEGSSSTTISSFNSNGYSVGTNPDWNDLNATFVSWNWKANGSGSTNTAGSITSTVSANTTSGFSIVTYTGTLANATVGHGLGVAPKMIIMKRRNSSAENWPVYHSSVGQGSVLLLNLTSAAISDTTAFNNTAPTSSVFSVGVSSGTNQGDMLAYCFAEVAGYSKFGSYTGNGSSDGPFVYCGFRPAYLMIKRTDANIDWLVWDSARSTYNVTNIVLYPNGSYAEAAGTAVAIDFLSNGFKIRNTDSSQNASGGNFIFAAFATAPFKFSLAR